MTATSMRREDGADNVTMIIAAQTASRAPGFMTWSSRTRDIMAISFLRLNQTLLKQCLETFAPNEAHLLGRLEPILWFGSASGGLDYSDARIVNQTFRKGLMNRTARI